MIKILKGKYVEKFIVELFKIKDDAEFRNKIREEEDEDYSNPLLYFIENYEFLREKYNFNYENFLRLLKNSNLSCCIDERGNDILSWLWFSKFKIKKEEFQYILERCRSGYNEDYMYTLEFIVMIMNFNKIKISEDLIWKVIRETDFSGELGGPIYNLLDLSYTIPTKNHKNNYFTDEQWMYMFSKIEKENSVELSERDIHEIIESDNCSLKEETISCLISKLDESLFNDEKIKYFLWHFLTTKNFDSRKNNLIKILNKIDKKVLSTNFLQLMRKWGHDDSDFWGTTDEKKLIAILENIDVNIVLDDGKTILDYCFIDCFGVDEMFSSKLVRSYLIKNVDEVHFKTIKKVNKNTHKFDFYRNLNAHIVGQDANFLVTYLYTDYATEDLECKLVTKKDFLTILKKTDLNKVIVFNKSIFHILFAGAHKFLDKKCCDYLIENTDIFNSGTQDKEENLLLSMITAQRLEDLELKGGYWDKIIMRSNLCYGGSLLAEALLKAYKDKVIPVTKNTPKIIKKAEKVLADFKTTKIYLYQ